MRLRGKERRKVRVRNQLPTTTLSSSHFVSTHISVEGMNFVVFMLVVLNLIASVS